MNPQDKDLHEANDKEDQEGHDNSILNQGPVGLQVGNFQNSTCRYNPIFGQGIPRFPCFGCCLDLQWNARSRVLLVCSYTKFIGDHVFHQCDVCLKYESCVIITLQKSVVYLEYSCSTTVMFVLC